LLAWIVSSGAITARCQNIDYLNSIGVPTFTTALPVENGFINAANGDLHLEIPLGSFPQRGGRQFEASLMYDSNIWGAGGGPWNVGMSGTDGGNSWGGWRLVTSVFSGSTNDEVDYSLCRQDGQPVWSIFQDFLWYAPDGTVHAFPIHTKYYWPTVCNNFNPPVGNPTGGAYAYDASGYYMSVTDYTTTTVNAPDGTIMTGFASSPSPTNKVEDANGNFYSEDNNFNPIDTLGRTLVKTTAGGSTISFGVSQFYYFDVPNSRGGTSRYTATLEMINVNAFAYSGSIPVIQSIALPDGTSYSFQYDSGTTAGHYGQLSSMMLPTGGQISYSFVNFLPPTTPYSSRQIGSRITPDSATPWTYTYSNVPNTCQTQIVYPALNCQVQTTVTKPSGDHSVYTFDVNGGAWPIEVQHYDASSNLLATITQTFDMSIPCPNHNIDPCSGLSAVFVTKKAATTTLPIPGGTNINQTTQYAWDTTHYGNITQKSEWNFYTGSLPTAADRTTNIAYLNGSSYITANILNRPATITVTDKNGNTVAQTANCYDYAGGCGGTSFTSVAGITQHDDTHYPATNTVRGDLTQVQKLISGTSYLTTSNIYDMTGQVLTSTDSAGNQTTYSHADNFYNDNGNTTNPVFYSPPAPTNAYVKTITQGSLVTTFGYYFGTGQKALSTDPNSQTTYFHFYDSMNRPTSTKLPNLYNGTCCGWTYDVYPNASETQVDTGIGITSTSLSISCTGSAGDCRHDQTLLDGLGRLSSKILVSDPDNQSTVGATYDLNGRVYTVSNPHRSSSFPTDGTESYFYDGLDRKKQVTRADGSIAYTSYGALIGSNGRSTQLCSGFGVGYPVLYKDEAAKLRQTWTDGFGGLIEVDEPDPSTGSLISGSPADTCYSYDLNNNLTGVTQGSQTRSFSYDMLSRLTAATNPESGTVNYYYTTLGGSLCSGDMSAVCRRTDARSKTTTYAYDALNRSTSKSYSDTTPGVAYGYDAVAPTGCTPPSLTITNGKGRRTSMCDGPGATAWSYDQVGNALTEKRTTNSVTDSFTYAYNLDSTVATIGYPSGRTMTYQPGGAQRPLSGKDVANSVNYATGAHYFPPGELGSLTSGSSINFTAITNNRLQPCWIYATTGTALSWSGTLCTTTETTAGNILDLKYGFNFGSSDNGNVMSITNNRDSTRSQAFTYDPLNRIATGAASTYAISPSHCWGESYIIDRYGNLSAIGSISSAYNGCTQDNLNISLSSTTNRITTSGFTYDSSGNLTSDGTHSPTYDAEGRIISDAGVTYYYDADGKRVQKSSGTLYWYGTSSDPLLETNASGSLINEYIFFGDKRISRRDSSSNIEYYFADQVDSARVVTNASGAILEDCDYFPYGGSGCSPSSVNNYLYTGKERDSESGLDNFGARYDSSQYGRFMTPDPIGGHTEDPQTLNKYAYVRNNPINLTDPTGLDFYISCGHDNDTNCHNGLSGTYGKPDNNGNRTFTATVISNDSDGNLVDQSGNRYNANVSGSGVSFSQAGSNQSSMGVFINGSNATTIQGTGGLSAFTFNFTYANPAGNVSAGGTFSYNGTFQQAERALETAGFPHYSSDDYDILHPSHLSYHAVDFRSAGQPGTGAGSGHFTVHEPWMTRPYMALIAPTPGDVHLGEHNNSSPGGFWPHTQEVINTLLDKLGLY
jgi:RHS repeat-associated protein